jgi:hypothetical protein
MFQSFYGTIGAADSTISNRVNAYSNILNHKALGDKTHGVRLWRAAGSRRFCSDGGAPMQPGSPRMALTHSLPRIPRIPVRTERIEIQQATKSAEFFSAPVLLVLEDLPPRLRG